MTSVMGSGEWTGYIAESLDAQTTRFDFRGGGATTAMNNSLVLSLKDCVIRGSEEFGAKRVQGGPRMVKQ
jgi:hypothetical protein